MDGESSNNWDNMPVGDLPKTDTIDGSSNKDCRNIFGNGSGDDKDYPDEQCRNVHDFSSIELTQWSEDHGTCVGWVRRYA